jgi:Trk K+ transport system NAD-binding subunit
LLAGWRDTLLLIREFGWPLLSFALVILGGGSTYYLLARNSPDAIPTWAESIYHVVGLTFLQPIEDFPTKSILQAYFFLMPLIGIAVLAQGVAEFGAQFFNRTARNKEWEMAVASTFDNHIILVGLGHLGFQAASNLIEIEQEIVVIEAEPKADLLKIIQDQGVPVIMDDANLETTLEAAGVTRAKAIMLCTQNDSINLQIAVKARALNPDIRVVVRIFDHDFAGAIQEQFGFTAMSSSQISGPSFSAAAAGVDITRPITVLGESLSLAMLEIGKHSDLNGMTVGDIETRFNVSVVLWQHDREVDYHPAPGTLVGPRETLGILAGLTEITKVLKANQSG